jgi:endonuclease/exonuclease/phosphatase family metal-dependent hydrolase
MGLRSMRVVTWNLFHGRSLPPAREELLAQFAAKLAGWEWDVALLQEVPPWWPQQLAHACGAEQRAALTSRNALLPLRRAVAQREPELIKSNGGGCNAILSRVPIGEHSTLRVRLWPERRVAQLVRLHDGTCVVNFHASTRRARAEQELVRLWEHALTWAETASLIFGGDLNLREPRAPGGEIEHVAAHEVDHLFAYGFARAGEAELLDRHAAHGSQLCQLSDHAPLCVRVGSGADSRR